MLDRIISLIIGYALGCIQNAYIVGKLKGIDIREHGSGNAGATNVARTLGMKYGFIVFLGDAMKGIIAYAIAYIVTKDSVVSLYAGFGAVMGHNFPLQLKLRGGKGVSTSVGLLYMINPTYGLILTIFGITLMYTTKYISVGSVLTAIFAPILYIIAFGTGERFVLVLILSSVLIIRHRTNIVRLLKGEEKKFSAKK